MSELEIWKPVDDGYGMYEVSNIGRVRSTKVFPSEIVVTIRKPVLNKGYPAITMLYFGKRRLVNIHRLVANAFIPNPENKREVNHKNGIRADNRIENLEWATPKENSRHAHATGLQNPINSRKAKLNREQIIDIQNSDKSPSELAKKYNVTTANIWYVRNRTWRKITETINEPTKEIYRPKINVDNKELISSTPFHP